jgi:HD-GYP domain-containing protein (c-di-GMP phosphodiesterase class II)
MYNMQGEVYIKDFMAEYGPIMENGYLKGRLGAFVESFSRDIDDIISSMLNEARTATSSEAAAIYVVDESVLHFAYMQSDTFYEDNPLHNLALKMDSDSICAYVARTRQPLMIGDVSSIPPTMPFRDNGEFDKVTGVPTISVISAPITDYAGNVTGILQLVNHRDENGEESPYEDWALGYVLLIIENFFPMISGAFDRYRSVFHSRRERREKSRAETAIAEMFNSVRSQVINPVSKTNLPWLKDARIPWSRRDMRKESNVSKRLMAFEHYVNQFDDINTVIEIMLTEARAATLASGGTFYLADPEGGDSLNLAYVQNDDIFAQGAARTRYLKDTLPADGASVVGYVASSREILNIPDVEALTKEGEYVPSALVDEVAEGNTRSLLTVPILDYRGNTLAVFQLVNARDVFGRPRVFEEIDVNYAETLARRAMPFITRSIMTRRLIDAMLRMSYMRDPVETGSHVRRVGAFAAEIYHRWAENRGISAEEIREEEDALRLAAMLHDIGKIAVPDSVLKKPAKLNDEEYDIIKTHCAKGASMYSLAHSRLEHLAYDITLHHHQRWDGRGYTGDPDVPVLAGEEIPLSARVTAVADVLDALIFPRVYKDSWDFDAAMEELAKNSGTQFDPEVTEATLQIAGTLRAIAERYQ